MTDTMTPYEQNELDSTQRREMSEHLRDGLQELADGWLENQNIPADVIAAAFMNVAGNIFMRAVGDKPADNNSETEKEPTSTDIQFN